MTIDQLIQAWESSAKRPVTEQRYAIRLPVYDAARVAALAELYPQRSEEEIVTDLLNAALTEVAKALPYVRGDRVISEDELGDPIYEDVGPTPRFHALTDKHVKRLGGDPPSAAGPARTP